MGLFGSNSPFDPLLDKATNEQATSEDWSLILCLEPNHQNEPQPTWLPADMTPGDKPCLKLANTSRHDVSHWQFQCQYLYYIMYVICYFLAFVEGDNG